MNIKTVQNNTLMDQFVVHNGTKWTLPPRNDPKSEQNLPVEVADKFLEKCKGLVSEVVIGGEFKSADDDKVWIANITGDPKQPETISLKSHYSKATGWQNEQRENPKRSPFPIVREVKGGMKEVTASDGTLEALNLLPSRIVLPPYQRIELPKSTARWFLERDKKQSAEMRGCVIKSRPKSSFEPDNSWGLDDLRLYLKLVDDKADVGPSERGLTHHKVNGKKKNNADMELLNARQEMLKRLYFYLVNPKVVLPTREEFYEFKNGPQEPDEELTEEEMNALLSNTARSISKQEANL